jgi:hypothetical protein
MTMDGLGMIMTDQETTLTNYGEAPWSEPISFTLLK